MDQEIRNSYVFGLPDPLAKRIDLTQLLPPVELAQVREQIEEEVRKVPLLRLADTERQELALPGQDDSEFWRCSLRERKLDVLAKLIAKHRGEGAPVDQLPKEEDLQHTAKLLQGVGSLIDGAEILYTFCEGAVLLCDLLLAVGVRHIETVLEQKGRADLRRQPGPEAGPEAEPEDKGEPRGTWDQRVLEGAGERDLVALVLALDGSALEASSQRMLRLVSTVGLPPVWISAGYMYERRRREALKARMEREVARAGKGLLQTAEWYLSEWDSFDRFPEIGNREILSVPLAWRKEFLPLGPLAEALDSHARDTALVLFHHGRAQMRWVLQFFGDRMAETTTNLLNMDYYLFSQAMKEIRYRPAHERIHQEVRRRRKELEITWRTRLGMPQKTI